MSSTRSHVTRVLLALLLTAAPLLAQTPSPTPAPRATVATPGFAPATRILKIHNGDPQQIAKVLALIGGKASADPGLHVIVWTGPPQLAEAVEAAAQSLDAKPTPAPNVELTVRFVAQADASIGKPLPEDLEAVARQLERAFGAHDLRLLGTASVRVADGARFHMEGTLPSRFGDDHVAHYNLSGHEVRLTRGDAPTVHVQRLRVWVDGFRSPNKRDTFTLETDLDVREGQRVVVSRASMNGFASGIFAIVTAHTVS